MDIGPGDRVRCISRKDLGRPGNMPESFGPVVGGIYTVAWVRSGSTYYMPNGIDGVYLCEFSQPDPMYDERLSWDIDIFVPLPDISEWLETSTTYEEPRRVPAPREVEGV